MTYIKNYVKWELHVCCILVSAEGIKVFYTTVNTSFLKLNFISLFAYDMYRGYILNHFDLKYFHLKISYLCHDPGLNPTWTGRLFPFFVSFLPFFALLFFLFFFFFSLSPLLFPPPLFLSPRIVLTLFRLPSYVPFPPLILSSPITTIFVGPTEHRITM